MVRRCERLDEDRPLHTLYLERCLVVVRLHFSTQDGRVLDGSEDHPIEMRIHAELRLASADVFEIATGLPLPDVAPRALRLELQVFFLGHRLLCSGGDELAVG